jgi:hypothetical protein
MEFNPPSKRSRSAQHNALLAGNLIGKNAVGVDNQARANGDNAKLPGALNGDLDAKYLLGREKPWHRTVLQMASAGYTNREVSKFVGRSVDAVENTLRQPFAREFLINEAKKTVQDEIKALLESEALPSIRKLVSVRDGEGVRPSDVIQASNSILDRFLGKPTQPITTDAKPMAELSDEELRAQVSAELSAVKTN